VNLQVCPSTDLKRCCTYVNKIEPEITIVLSPVITIPRHEDRATRFIGEGFAMVMLLVVLLRASYYFL